LFGVVHHFLLARWSPERIALKLARIYPKGYKSVSVPGTHLSSMADTMVSGYSLIAMPCCHSLYSTPQYRSMNFSAG
jgi:hypothetical protein